MIGARHNTQHTRRRKRANTRRTNGRTHTYTMDFRLGGFNPLTLEAIEISC